MRKFNKSLHIFRRDLRVRDNTALISALKHSGQVIPCFILDNRQIRNNPYASPNALEFLAGCLRDLDEQLRTAGGRLYFFAGLTEEILEQLIIDQKIEAVFCNRDYTPFARARDEKMAAICRNHGVDFHNPGDSLLIEPEQVYTGGGKPYTVFSAFYRKASLHPVQAPRKNTHANYSQSEIVGSHTAGIIDELLPYKNDRIIQRGGRSEALSQIKRITDLGEYESDRNIPSVNGTSLLSAHNKFGTLSIREVYHSVFENLGPAHGLIRELYWRDFFTHVAFHFPRVFGKSFHEQYDEIEWENDAQKFEAWCRGETGFPLVDAGMRQLNTTGWMHNRVRMVVASFLVKDLLIDWRWGEKYFAQRLVDYDPSVNNGNWQWAASTGCDAQPWFRIFNPWRQQEKFDPGCRYIKNWVPELDSTGPKTIHKLYLPDTRVAGYPVPVIDHSEVSSVVKQIFAAASRRRKSIIHH